MSAHSGRSAWRSALAGTVLAGLAWSLIAPALSAGGHELQHCAPAGTAAAPVVQAGPHGGCGHLEPGACEAALVCASLPSIALTGQGVVPAEALPFSRAVVPAVASVADLFSGGPPTPPPNS